jgi:hypothetical protein
MGSWLTASDAELEAEFWKSERKINALREKLREEYHRVHFFRRVMLRKKVLQAAVQKAVRG